METQIKIESQRSAQGQAKALDMIAQAESNYIETLKKICTHSEAAQLLMAQKYIDGFGVISKNPADKVFIPNSFTGLFSFPVNSGTCDADPAQRTSKD